MEVTEEEKSDKCNEEKRKGVVEGRRPRGPLARLCEIKAHFTGSFYCGLDISFVSLCLYPCYSVFQSVQLVQFPGGRVRNTTVFLFLFHIHFSHFRLRPLSRSQFYLSILLFFHLQQKITKGMKNLLPNALLKHWLHFFSSK